MTTQIKLGLLILGGMGALIGAQAWNDIRQKRYLLEKQAADQKHALRLAEVESQYPVEYWEAKKVEAEEQTKRREAEIASSERLEQDRRDRAAAEAEAQREWEKTAPAEYWEQKRIAEEEATKRHQADIDAERVRRLDERERETAKRNAEVIKESTRSLERAIRYGNSYGNLTLL